MAAKEGRADHLVTDRWAGQWTDAVTGRKSVTVASQNAQIYDSVTIPQREERQCWPE
jgi:hypothetical protein